MIFCWYFNRWFEMSFDICWNSSMSIVTTTESSFRILKSYTTSLNVNSIATLNELFNWACKTNKNNFQSMSKKTMIKYFSAISIVWFVFFELSLICECQTVLINILILSLMKKNCHKSDVNFEFLFEIIISKIFQFAISRCINNKWIYFSTL